MYSVCETLHSLTTLAGAVDSTARQSALEGYMTEWCMQGVSQERAVYTPNCLGTLASVHASPPSPTSEPHIHSPEI